MASLSVKDQIRKIVELQKIDGELYHLRGALRDKPLVLEQLRAEFERYKGSLTELEEKLKVVQMARREKELELKAKEDELARAKVQLSQIKTNKEYTAKISEIEHIKADKAVIEEKILVSYDESDAVHMEIEREKAKVADREKDYLAKKKEIEADVKLIEDRLKVLDGQRRQASPGIDPASLDRYERILKHKDGVAVVAVHGNTCGGCFMNITPQQLNAIKMYDHLVECEMCSRILYLEDDL